LDSATISADRDRPRRASGVLLIAVLAVSAALAGVGSIGDGRGPLVGRTYLSHSVTVAGEARPLVAGTQMWLAFEGDGRVAASAGCNRHGGRVRIERDRIVITDVFQTIAGCSAERSEQDEWLSTVLAADPYYVLDGESLRLTFDDTTIELLDSKVADPDRPLQKTRWRLSAMKPLATRPTNGAVATVVFDGSRVDVAVEGCNEATALATVTAKEIQVVHWVSTDRGCSGPEATAFTAIAAVLDGKVRYSIDAGKLTLVHPSGRELYFRATD
jgi:heat shock protein HslJ